MDLRENFGFFMPTRIFFGVDSILKVSNIVSLYKPKKILIITGRSSAKKSGILKRLTDILCDYESFFFDEVDINPSLDMIERGAEFAKEQRIELAIGVGGGSALDAGKCIALMAKQRFSIKTYFNRKKNLKRGVPFVAIPTTSGTGSEVTRWASIWDHQEKRKFSLEHPFLYPASGIIDPILTVSKPKFLTAVTGLDALCHAVEAYWSRNSNPISDIFAEKAIQLIVKNLTKAVRSPEALEYRVHMARASLYAGLAFSQTKTTACHAISYPLTAHFKVPHGLACALTLPYVFKFNASAIGQKAQKLTEWFSGDGIESTSQKILDLIKSLDVPTRLREIDVNIEDVEGIFQADSLTDRITNNPKEITKRDLTQIIENIL